MLIDVVIPVLGLIIGAIFVQYASWSWVFWFVAMVAFPIAIICFLLVPPQEEVVHVEGARWKSLDIGGVSIDSCVFSGVDSFHFRHHIRFGRWLGNR